VVRVDDVELPSAIPAFIEACARCAAEAASTGDLAGARQLAARILWVLEISARRGAAPPPIAGCTLALVLVSLLLVPLGLAGRLYAATALVSGAALSAYAVAGVLDRCASTA